MSTKSFDQCPTISSPSVLNCVADCDEHLPSSSTALYDLSASCVMSAQALPSLRETDRVDDVSNQSANDHFFKTKTGECDNDDNCIDGGGGCGEKIQTEMNHLHWMRSYYHRPAR